MSAKSKELECFFEFSNSIRTFFINRTTPTQNKFIGKRVESQQLAKMSSSGSDSGAENEYQPGDIFKKHIEEKNADKIQKTATAAEKTQKAAEKAKSKKKGKKQENDPKIKTTKD